MPERRRPWYLRHWRQHRNLTQDQFAKLTGYSKPYISQLERGERQFNQDLLELFALRLDCAPVDLLERSPAEPEGLWSLWGGLSADQRRKALEILRAMKQANA